MSIQIINPVNRPDWNKLLQNTPEANIFHTREWASVMHNTYDYTPCYFTEMSWDKIETLIPVMEVNSWVTGTRGVSLPFTDFSPILISDKGIWKEAFNEIINYAETHNFKYLEFRSDLPGNAEYTPSTSFYAHILPVNKEVDALYKNLHSSTKRNIKKAEKAGIRIEKHQSLQALQSFYTLHCKTRKRHGVPVQPWSFFENIFEEIFKNNLGHILMARHEDLWIAGAVYFYFNKKAVYKFGASDMHYQHMRPNDLVMWKAIQEFSESGFESLHFGRTDLHHEGLRRYKMGWGSEEERLNYFRYDPFKKQFTEGNENTNETLSPLKFTPIPFLKLLGKVAYRHVA